MDWVDPMLLRNESNHMRWFEYVVTISSGVLPGEVVWTCPTEKRPLQKDLGHNGGTMYNCPRIPPEELLLSHLQPLVSYLKICTFKDGHRVWDSLATMRQHWSQIKVTYWGTTLDFMIMVGIVTTWSNLECHFAISAYCQSKYVFVLVWTQWCGCILDSRAEKVIHLSFAKHTDVRIQTPI